MNSHDSITQEYVQSLFDYHEDGYLLWKTTGKGIAKNRIAGSLDKSKGYFSVMIDGKNYYVHRVIFLIHYGYLPKYIDHKDTNRSNNKVDNLREATSTQNKGNAYKKRNNTSGFKGVSWSKPSNKWQAAITQNSRPVHLGVFSDKISAAKAYNEAALKYFGEFARLNEIP